MTLTTPLNKNKMSLLHIGDQVLITGTLYTARDAAHRLIVHAIRLGEKLPFVLEGSVIYYAGPAPAPPGLPIGSCGPTTSGRMDPYVETLLEAGVCGMIGKGPRSKLATDAIKKHGAVYFAALGGAGALLATRVKSCEIVAWPELGPEAVHKLEVVEFPCVVAVDPHGNDLFDQAASRHCSSK